MKGCRIAKLRVARKTQEAAIREDKPGQHLIFYNGFWHRLKGLPGYTYIKSKGKVITVRIENV
jgi:hypothetical protein